MSWTKINFNRNNTQSECSRCTHKFVSGSVAYKKSFQHLDFEGCRFHEVEIVCGRCQHNHALIVGGEQKKKQKKKKK